MQKPVVDAMKGLSPAVPIEQKNPTTSSRSTVGTATEIYDFLRLLWARAGTQAGVRCGHEVKADTVQEVEDAILTGAGNGNTEGAKQAAPLLDPIMITSPRPPSA